MFFIFIPFLGFSQSQTFTTPGTTTFTVPAGITTLQVETWGGGGKGGSRSTTGTSGGGGGGAYVKKTITVVAGSTYNLQVGSGSAAQTTPISSDSWFLNTTTIIAKGGNSVADNISNGVNGGGTGSIGTLLVGGKGADGVTGKSGGGGGSSAGIFLAGNNATNASGAIAPNGGGKGGDAKSVSSGIGSVGLSPGGGGGGAYRTSDGTSSGGNGSNGQLKITWGPQEINLLGNNTSILNGSTIPSILDDTYFGSVDTNAGTIYKTYTIQNIGSSNLIINSVSVTGSDFTITTAPSFPATIVGISSLNFIVTFNPSTIGTKTAVISISNTDSNENPYTFTIQGGGIETFFDSDGDGILDNVDIDDDNDGIKDDTEELNCKSISANKVNYKFLNETFGTGGRTSNFTAAYNATTTYCYEDGIVGTNTAECPSQSSKILDDGEYCVVSKITGTTASDPDNIHGDLAWYNGEDHTTGDTNGRMAVFNASFTPGVFYETTITGVLSNLPITYSFWVLNILAPSTFPNTILPNVTVEFYDLSNNFLTSFNTGDIGRCSGSITDNSCSQGVWKQFSTSVNLGNVNAFTIRFKNNAPGGSGNDLALDDILISQTLCDLDYDGVADLFDLDADNDGIEDVIEVGLGNLSNGKGKIDVAWVDANGNGLHDNAESNAALTALDSDGDGTPNYLDLDSDNDSIFDVDESGAGNSNAITGFVNGDGDINGDGTGNGLDTETFRIKDTDGNGSNELFGDGILDIFDFGTGVNQYGNLGQGSTIAPFLNYILDTDNDGIPNYIDVKSNDLTFDIANTLLIYDYKTLDTNNDGIIDGTTDIDKDGILDAFDTNTAYFGSPRDLHTKLLLDFDGRNDYGQSTSILGGLTNASLMAWINLNAAFSTEGVIVGQDKFQIRVTAAKKLEAVVNGATVTFATALNTSQWYNVGTVYDGSNLKLYLNGTLVATQATSGTIASDPSVLTLGKNPVANTKYFKGKIDEIRVFNVALTDSQLQRMVYQEIQDTGSEVGGTIVPKNIATSPASLPFANLLRYYRMDNYKDDIIDDLTTPTIDVSGTKIYNHKNIYLQQAPLPFLTERTGSFATAVNSPSKEIRGNDTMENDWSIVKVQHDITETANNIDLGMVVDSGKKIVMNNNTKLQNDWYLKLDGIIDLTGMAQLVQTTESDLDVTSAGYIERDQQGQSNLYNYNYWSAPVSPINTVANNTNYTVNGVFRDGTNPATPASITWVSGYNGAPTSPVSMARYWLYKFDNNASAYANWIQINETSALRVGQGFTLKGSGALSGTQNYTFIGKPNNGTILTNTVSADQLLLTGNPYPSAIDAYAFINDNLNSVDRIQDNGLDGTIYFWEHSSNNNSHVLKEYLGGYAVLNLSGGLPPVVPGMISGVGLSNKIPKQHIPVGQGFFVYGKTGGGGTVIFKNSQRAFQRETDATSNTLFKIKPKGKDKNTWNTNNSDLVQKDTLKRIRLGFNSSTNFHRQVLLAFMQEKATSAVDYGYDGFILDNYPNDMYFLNGSDQLVIQGEGYFDLESSYPIGIKTDREGLVKFLIDDLENFESNQPIFIYDDETKIYHNIRNQIFEINIPKGEFHTRFSLRFKDKTLGVSEKINSGNDIIILHSQNRDALMINNKIVDTTLQEITLFNILGQAVASWDLKNQDQQDIQLPLKKMSSGVYIVKLKTSTGVLSKKIIIK
ncbi:LamG-like jellyroll fold domain-containing protein [Flavobacterium sp. LB2P44]|uniref:LamG-like jellyroll fold domain-containing protein n=1 Tax=Flavobacterium sp. LB2P44 TaxID=3401713 RepID=UPI003AAF21BD